MLFLPLVFLRLEKSALDSSPGCAFSSPKCPGLCPQCAAAAAPSPPPRPYGYLVGHFSQPHHSGLFQPRVPGVQGMHAIPEGANRGRQDKLSPYPDWSTRGTDACLTSLPRRKGSGLHSLLRLGSWGNQETWVIQTANLDFLSSQKCVRLQI